MLTQYITDFADQAVILPVSVAVLAALLATGWRRGAIAWIVSVAGVLAIMLGLKIVVYSCAGLMARTGLESPSGHTASASAVYGGLLALLAKQTRPGIAVAAIAAGGVALAVGLTRLALGVHTVPDVTAGAFVGVVGAMVMRLLAGVRPDPLPRRWLLLAAVMAMALFHGARLEAEQRLRWAGWHLPVCKTALPDLASGARP